LRVEYVMPILMLTAKEEEEDRVKGLELSADDYIIKPFNTKELIARVRANLRRVKLSSANDDNFSKILKVRNIELNFNTFEVSKNGGIVDLTNREFDLLKYFVLNPDKAFRREHLLKKVWNYDFGDLRTVDVTVRRLREKIENSEDKYIITKRGVGYYFSSK